MHDVVTKLLGMEAELIVTITAPLDRQRPANDADRIRIRNLVASARSQVLDAWSPDRAAPVLDRLADAAARVEFDTGAHGVVIVVTPDDAEIHHVPFPVAEAVVLGTTPATRHLVQGLRRSPRYRVLVISDRATRLFEAVRDEAVEVTDHGFPFTANIVPNDRRAVAGRFALPTGGDDSEQQRAFYRTVDRALADLDRDDPLPLILSGVRTSTALFEATSRNTDHLIGRLDGAHDTATAHEIGRAAWPTVQAHLRARRRDAVAELADAVNAGRAVTGMDEAWKLGRVGRGRLLVVEEDYRDDPAREVDGRLVAPGIGERDVIADPVDELIEHVVRAGGTPEFVAPGALEEYGRIGLILR